MVGPTIHVLNVFFIFFGYLQVLCAICSIGECEKAWKISAWSLCTNKEDMKTQQINK